MIKKTLFDKLWENRQILKRSDGVSLLWVDRHFIHEGSHHAFSKLADRNLRVAQPTLTFAVFDHYVSTSKKGEVNIGAEKMIQRLKKNASENQIFSFDEADPRQGIAHVVGPEQGLTLPGLLINCGDSHTSTHGAFGSVAFGIGASEVAHVLATQTIWQKKPKKMRITISGALGKLVTPKDVALHWINSVSTGGATGFAIEYAGSVVRSMSMEGRMTLCNMSIEGGARMGMISPDETTYNYLKDKPFAPKGVNWELATNDWSQLYSDQGANFEKEINISAKDIAPSVTWGTCPDETLPITGSVPNPKDVTGTERKKMIESIEYMGLKAGQPLKTVKVDQVFIGSCTNGRIEDLRLAATILSGRKAKVPGLVSPGSMLVKKQAEEEGLDEIFRSSGLEWVNSGCSMCVGMNGDFVSPGKRCASTTNRNFKGRQGRGARTHLMNPAMAAAAAITGYLSDARDFWK